MKSRRVCPEAVRKIRESKWEAEDAGHEINPTLLLGLQARQRAEQPCQKSDTRTVDFPELIGYRGALRNHLLRLLGGDHLLLILGGHHQTGRSTEQRFLCERRGV